MDKRRISFALSCAKVGADSSLQPSVSSALPISVVGEFSPSFA